MGFRRVAVAALAAFAVGVLAFPASAMFRVQPTISAVSSTSTVQGITIASHTATSVIVSTDPIYAGVYVQNISQTGAIFCGDTTSVSTQTANGLVGVALSSAAAISPPLPYYFPVPEGKNWYCMCNGNNQTCRAVIHRVR